MNAEQQQALIATVGNALREARAAKTRSDILTALRTIGRAFADVLETLPHPQALQVLATVRNATGMTGDEFCFAMTSHKAGQKKTRPLVPVQIKPNLADMRN